MKWFFIILLFSLGNLNAQVFDDFSDGDFTDFPQWIGTTELFRVNAESMSLQLFAPAEAGEAWLFTESQAVENAQWQFYFQMNFNPSSSNYAKVYLTSDSHIIDNIGNSFYLVLGTSADNISLWEKRDGIDKKLIDGEAGRLNLSNVTRIIRVTRKIGGLFILESNIADGGWVEEGRYETSNGMASEYFGLSCHYTQTRSNHFFFDDFEVTGESFKDTVVVYIPKYNDIVISEIMPDPSPPVKLPDSEYIELYNRSEFPIQMGGFRLTVGSRTATLREYLLYPDDYLLLVPSTQAESWSSVTNCLAVTSWSALPNAGGDIILSDKHNNTIASLQYDLQMGETGFKQDGGWSFEIVDFDNLSGDWDNWGFSVNEYGGTPGFANSTRAKYHDNIPPLLLDGYVENDSCIIIEFSEAINPDIFPENCKIEPEILTIATIEAEEPFFKTIKVCFTDKIPENRMFDFYFEILPKDFAGNNLYGDGKFTFGMPVAPENDDIIINELLYNPPTGGSDFVELYNKSDNLIDLSQLYLSRGNSNGLPDRLIPLSNEKRVFFPKSYIAYTGDNRWLMEYYSVENEKSIRQLSDLPNYPIGESTVFLTNINGEIFDRFDYDDKMHFALLGTNKGVSLERINPDESTNSRANWHSASAEQRYGTPGKRNSQAYSPEKTDGNDFIQIEPPVFTPNQDGVDDLLFIKYKFDEQGNSCTVTIFNRAGQAVRHLENNALAGIEGFFAWDGLDDNKTRCSTGIYIILIRSFHPNGKVQETRKVAVLGYGRN